MLRFNGTYMDRVKYLGGSLHSTNLNRIRYKQKLIEHRQKFGSSVSMPQGYQSAYRALLPTFSTSGFMSSIIRGSGSFNSSITSIGNMLAILAGVGSIDANANSAVNMHITLAGNSTFNANVTSIGWMSATLDAGARPSAFDIAQEVFGSIVESGVNFKEVLRILVAIAAGRTTINNLGSGNATVNFRDLANAKNRISASMEGSSRVDVSLDLD